MRIGLSLNIGGPQNVTGGGGTVIDSLSAMVTAQVDDFAALYDSTASGTAFALTNAVRLNGDSTMASVRDSDVISDRRDPAVRMGEFITSTVNNIATGGDSLALILTEMTQSPQTGQYGDTWIIQGGINGSTNHSQNVSDWNSLFALFAHSRLAWVPPHGGDTQDIDAAGGVVVRKQFKHLIDNATGLVWDRWQVIAEQAIGAGSVSTADRDSLARGSLPADSMGVPAPSTDNIHLGTNFYEPWSTHMSMIGRALEDDAYPYVQPTYLTVDSTQAAASAIGNLDVTGTLSSVTITAGNDDNLIAISNTGAVTRGAGTFDLDDFREVFFSYSGSGGETRHGRLVLGRWDSTDTGPSFRFKKAGAAYLGETRLVAETTGNFPGWSIIMLGQHSVTDKARELVGSASMLGQVTASGTGTAINCHSDGATAMRLRLLMRDSAGAFVGNAFTPNAPAAGTDTWWMISYDQTTGALRIGTNGTVTSSTISTANPATFLDGLRFGGGTFPSDASLRMLWFAPTYIDWSSSTERDRFFNSGTLAPVDIGTGVVNSITPDVYLHGGAGGLAGWVPPCNAHGTLDLFGTPWTSAATTDLEAGA